VSVVADGTGSRAPGPMKGHGHPGMLDRIRALAVTKTAGPPPSPFRREGLLARIAPFAVVAVLAELSMALPPGPSSALTATLAVALLALAAAAVFLPWSRLPGWATVIVPLLYTASVLPLVLAAGGATSGVSVVLLIPLVWTVLFHRPWESAWVWAGILVVLFVISVSSDTSPTAYIVRRLVFWGLLTAMIAVAGHGLRARISRSQEAAARVQGHLREVSIMQDRERIAGSLQDNVVQRLFAAGLSLQGTGALSGVPEVSRRIDAVVHNLDEAIRLLRQSIFGLEHGLPEQGLRRSILDVSNELTPALGLVPEVTLDGPIDTEVPPRVAGHLLAALRETLSRSGATVRATKVTVAVIARDDEVSLTVTDNGGRWAARTSTDGLRLASLRDRARRLGGTVELAAAETGRSRLIWRVPLITPPRTPPEGDGKRPGTSGTQQAAPR
jgi:signal transduction histidine kinase